MAVKDIHPTSWISNYSFSEPNITIPRTDFTERTLSAANAAGATGDVRSLLFSILEQIMAEQVDRVAADPDDVLDTMIISKKTSVSGSSAGFGILSTFTVSFKNSIDDIPLADE